MAHELAHEPRFNFAGQLVGGGFLHDQPHGWPAIAGQPDGEPDGDPAGDGQPDGEPDGEDGGTEPALSGRRRKQA